ncbi:MAG TPA: hypothetical protein VG890_07180 [Puia sp.]|nr:hypothetical protein [Puia sp.]
MKIIHWLFVISVFSLFIFSCSKANEEELSGGSGGSCDTTGMKYTANVVPILQMNCYSCHGEGNTSGSGGIRLDTYDNLKVYADNGYLVGNITHAPGYVGMPFGQPKMDDCSINTIVDWVNRGAPND